MKIFMLIGLISVGLANSQNTQQPCRPRSTHLLPYPGNCQRFIRCINGVAFNQDCEPGLGFDAQLEVCSVAAIERCNICEGNEPHNIMFVRDEQDCAKYFMCIGTQFNELRCPNGLLFNINATSCDYQRNVYCPNYIPGTDGTCTITQDFDFIASPNSCTRYTVCSFGNSKVRYCPSGLIFDVVTKTCNTLDQGHCLSDSAPLCPPDTVERIAHPYDCRYYVLCNHGSRTLMACAPGLEVNRETNQCDHPHIAQCTSAIY